MNQYHQYSLSFLSSLFLWICLSQFKSSSLSHLFFLSFWLIYFFTFIFKVFLILLFSLISSLPYSSILDVHLYLFSHLAFSLDAFLTSHFPLISLCIFHSLLFSIILFSSIVISFRFSMFFFNYFSTQLLCFQNRQKKKKIQDFLSFEMKYFHYISCIAIINMTFHQV